MMKRALAGLWVTCVCVSAALVGVAAKPPARLPSGWSSVDIGNTGLAGSGSYANGGAVFTVAGAGSDIGGTADAFQFVSESLAADVSIAARVATEMNTDAAAKAGLMLRDGLGPNAVDVVLDVRPGGAVEFVTRRTSGGTTTTLATAVQPLPVYLKLTRSGTTVMAYVSSNGSTWSAVGATSVTMAPTINVGLAVTSHTTTRLNSSTFDHVSVTNSAPLPPSTPTAPTPGADSTGVATSTSLGWSAGGATSYDVSLGTADPPPAMATNLVSPAYTLSSLKSGTTYFWRITARNSAGNTVGPTWTFATAAATVTPPPPPAAPTSPTPGNGATSVATTATLGWTASGATSYDISFGSTNPPPSVAVGLTTATYVPAGISAGTTYYWQVTSRNSGGSAVGPVWSFSTAAVLLPPAVPATPAPTSGASGVGLTPALSWTAGGATSYDVRFGTSSAPPTVSTAQAASTFAPAALTGGATYFWQIVARNASGSTAGPIWSLTTVAAATGNTWTVNAGGDLQAAINGAQPGDTILVQAGATFTGNFVLPNKNGSNYITIRSSAADTLLPATTTRIDPSFAAQLPKIRSGNSMPAMTTMAGAHHYRLLFLEFLANSQGYGDILDLGDGSTAQNTLASIPHDLVVDRVYLHGDVTYGQKRGIGLNSGTTSILNSYIAEIKAVGQDSQAICGWNGPGPYTIRNNYLEAAGENVLIGGSDPGIVDLIPSDITFTGNYVAKQLAWRTQSWSVKNLFELKNAQRVTINGNVFEYNWQAGQNGYAIAFTPRNQGGTAPWSVVQQVQFTNNVVRHTASGFNILGTDDEHPSQLTNHITIRNNLLVDISAAAYGGDGRFMIIGGGAYMTVDHNTVFNDGSSTVYTYATPVPGFVFTNNIIPDNAWAFIGDNTGGVGNPTITQYFPSGVFLDGIYAKASPSMYPTGNYFPASMSTVGFVDLAGGNYRLASTSLYRLSATDGTDVGCSIDAVNTATGLKY